MKRLIWIATAAYALTQTVHAITVNSFGTSSSSASAGTAVVTPTPVVTTTPSSTSSVNVNTATRTLAPISSGLSGTSGISFGGTVRNYSPSQIIRNPGIRVPTKPTTPPKTTTGGPTHVPDGGPTAGLLSMAILGAAVMKRKLAA